MKEDFAGPFPCENLTGCTFPWPIRAGQNMQPQHDLGGAFQGSCSSYVCPIPGLEQRLLACLTELTAWVLQFQSDILRVLGQGGGKNVSRIY